MARKLVTYVSVPDESGRVHEFGPDDELPAWARKAITNPKAFDGGEDEPDENNGVDAPTRVENAKAKAERTPDATAAPASAQTDAKVAADKGTADKGTANK